MATFKHIAKKLRLIKKGTHTRWAPVWTVPKKYGTGRRVHPGRHTHVKRNWRRGSTKV